MPLPCPFLQFVTNVYDFPTKRMRMGTGINAIHTVPMLRGGDAPATAPVGGAATDLIVTLETIDAMYQVTKVTGSVASSQAPVEFMLDDAITPQDIKVGVRSAWRPAVALAFLPQPVVRPGSSDSRCKEVAYAWSTG
jgi:hypothetical protein